MRVPARPCDSAKYSSMSLSWFSGKYSSVARRELVDLVPADQERRSEETSSLKYSVVLFLFWKRMLKD